MTKIEDRVQDLEERFVEVVRDCDILEDINNLYHEFLNELMSEAESEELHDQIVSVLREADAIKFDRY